MSGLGAVPWLNIRNIVLILYASKGGLTQIFVQHTLLKSPGYTIAGSRRGLYETLVEILSGNLSEKSRLGD